VICAKETLDAATHCAAGPNYIRPVHGLETFTCFHFDTALGFRRHSISRREQQHHRALILHAPRPHMRTKTLVVFRSKSIGFEEEKMS
jgi:hypothetical protein